MLSWDNKARCSCDDGIIYVVSLHHESDCPFHDHTDLALQDHCPCQGGFMTVSKYSNSNQRYKCVLLFLQFKQTATM